MLIQARSVKCLASTIVILACVLAPNRRHLAWAQYGYGVQNSKSNPNNYRYQYHEHQNHYGGMESAEEEQEERPRINLGFRLRVPAMKLELPPFNLPKITVTAKIRQPDGPRIIKLPAINLDTSSRLEAPGAREQPKQMMMHQQTYGADQSGFDDGTSARYNRYPNSPASRVRQQHNHQSGYHSSQNYASAASSYHRANAYRAPQMYHRSKNRF